MDKDQKNQNKNKEKEDRALWEYATKDVIPLHDKHEIYTQHTTEKPNFQKQVIQKRDVHPKLKPQNPAQSNETDRKTAQKLKRGQIKIESRLDLHGMSKSLAYASLKNFIENAYKNNLKCVLVITGKGTPRHGNIPLADQTHGILKTSVPHWLQEADFRSYVLKFEIAKPKDGGEGALYILLRRNN